MCLPQGVEEWNRRDDVNIRIVDVQVQKVRIVADEVRGFTVHRAQQKSNVIVINRIMAEVEIFYFHDLGEEDDLSKEGKGGGVVDAAFAKFEGIFRSNIPRNEQGEFSLKPAPDDFAVGTGR